jgi:hypothetical protein
MKIQHSRVYSSLNNDTEILIYQKEISLTKFFGLDIFLKNS